MTGQLVPHRGCWQLTSFEVSLLLLLGLSCCSITWAAASPQWAQLPLQSQRPLPSSRLARLGLFADLLTGDPVLAGRQQVCQAFGLLAIAASAASLASFALALPTADASNVRRRAFCRGRETSARLSMRFLIASAVASVVSVASDLILCGLMLRLHFDWSDSIANSAEGLATTGSGASLDLSMALAGMSLIGQGLGTAFALLMVRRLGRPEIDTEAAAGAQAKAGRQPKLIASSRLRGSSWAMDLMDPANQNAPSRTDTSKQDEPSRTDPANQSKTSSNNPANQNESSHPDPTNPNEPSRPDPTNQNEPSRPGPTNPNELSHTERADQSGPSCADATNQNESRRTEPANQNQLSHTGKADQSELSRSEPANRNESSHTDPANQNESSRTGPANYNEYIHTDSAKYNEPSRTDPANQEERNQTVPASESTRASTEAMTNQDIFFQF